MKKIISIVLSLLIMGIFSPAFANTIKWSMPGDSLTLDPHAQNEDQHTWFLVKYMKAW